MDAQLGVVWRAWFDPDLNGWEIHNPPVSDHPVIAVVESKIDVEDSNLRPSPPKVDFPVRNSDVPRIELDNSVDPREGLLWGTFFDVPPFLSDYLGWPATIVITVSVADSRMTDQEAFGVGALQDLKVNVGDLLAGAAISVARSYGNDAGLFATMAISGYLKTMIPQIAVGCRVNTARSKANHASWFVAVNCDIHTGSLRQPRQMAEFATTAAPRIRRASAGNEVSPVRQ